MLEPSDTERRWLMAGQVAVGMLLIYLLFRLADWNRMAEAWHQAEPGLWIPAALLFAIYVLLGWWSITVLIAEIDLRHWRQGLLDYGACQAFSLVTPGRIGELALPLILRRCATTPGEVTAILVIQRISNLLLLALLLFGTSHTWLPANIAWLSLLTTFAGSLLIVLLLTHTTLLQRLEKLTDRFHIEFVTDFDRAWQGIYRNRHAALGNHTLLSGLRILALSIGSYLIALSLGVEVPIEAYVGITAASALANFIPLTIWGLGISEGVMVFGLAHFGVDSGIALAIGLIGRALFMISLFAWSAAYLLDRVRTG